MTTTVQSPTGETVVEAVGIHVTLGTSHILRGIDLSVHDGEIVALLGANGSGKSTLVRTLVGILPSTEGTVTLYGKPLGRQVPWKNIGYVPQRVSAGTGVPSTAAEVVASGLLYGLKIRTPRNASARTLDALDQVGLADLADRSVNELSGGQQQRVLIARALVREPRLLLLDEPVAGVDQPSQENFAETLSNLAAHGTTVLVVLHELGALAPLITRTVVLRHGRKVHDGAPLPPAPEHAAAGHQHLHPASSTAQTPVSLIQDAGFGS